jgi:hypothetical protein
VWNGWHDVLPEPVFVESSQLEQFSAQVLIHLGSSKYTIHSLCHEVMVELSKGVACAPEKRRLNVSKERVVRRINDPKKQAAIDPVLEELTAV